MKIPYAVATGKLVIVAIILLCALYTGGQQQENRQAPSASSELRTPGKGKATVKQPGFIPVTFSSIHISGDVWLLSQILHDWSDAECRIILDNIRARMSAGDRVLVAEMVTVPCNPDPVIGMLDVQMLTLFGNARQRTVDE